MNTEKNITKNEMRFFQNDMLTELKKMEIQVTNKLTTFNQTLSSKIIDYDSKFSKIFENINELISQVATNKFNNERIDELISAKSKFSDQINENHSHISTIEKTLENSLYKYDKAILDNLQVPGLIGVSCKFKNCKLFFEFIYNEMKKAKKSKEEEKTLSKTFQEKIDYKVFKIENELNKILQSINEICQTKFEKYAKKMEQRALATEEIVHSTRIENSKYANELIKTSTSLEIEWNKLENIKEEIYKKFYEELDIFKKLIDSTNRTFHHQENDFKIFKQRFTQLADYLKDFRNYKNKEYRELTKNIDFNKKQKLDSNFDNENYDKTANDISEFIRTTSPKRKTQNYIPNDNKNRRESFSSVNKKEMNVNPKPPRRKSMFDFKNKNQLIPQNNISLEKKLNKTKIKNVEVQPDINKKNENSKIKEEEKKDSDMIIKHIKKKKIIITENNIDLNFDTTKNKGKNKSKENENKEELESLSSSSSSSGFSCSSMTISLHKVKDIEKEKEKEKKEIDKKLKNDIEKEKEKEIRKKEIDKEKEKEKDKKNSREKQNIKEKNKENINKKIFNIVNLDIKNKEREKNKIKKIDNNKNIENENNKSSNLTKDKIIKKEKEKEIEKDIIIKFSNKDKINEKVNNILKIDNKDKNINKENNKENSKEKIIIKEKKLEKENINNSFNLKENIIDNKVIIKENNISKINNDINIKTNININNKDNKNNIKEEEFNIEEKENKKDNIDNNNNKNIIQNNLNLNNNIQKINNIINNNENIAQITESKKNLKLILDENDDDSNNNSNCISINDDFLKDKITKGIKKFEKNSIFVQKDNVTKQINDFNNKNAFGNNSRRESIKKSSQEINFPQIKTISNELTRYDKIKLIDYTPRQTLNTNMTTEKSEIGKNNSHRFKRNQFKMSNLIQKADSNEQLINNNLNNTKKNASSRILGKVKEKIEGKEEKEKDAVKLNTFYKTFDNSKNDIKKINDNKIDITKNNAFLTSLNNINNNYNYNYYKNNNTNDDSSLINIIHFKNNDDKISKFSNKIDILNGNIKSLNNRINTLEDKYQSIFSELKNILKIISHHYHHKRKTQRQSKEDKKNKTEDINKKFMSKIKELYNDEEFNIKIKENKYNSTLKKIEPYLIKKFKENK